MPADVSTPSAERSAMDRDLEMIADIRAGADAIRMRSARYLPKYEMESSAEYARRVQVAPWRPEFVDSLRNLASKPFATDVLVAEDTPPDIQALVEDIDGRGNNLTRFAHEAFTEALANGVHGILVDYSVTALNASRADEIASGARPYWIQLPVGSIIALRTEMVGGREIVTHLRFKTNRVSYDGFDEKVVDQVRVIESDRWQTWEKAAPGAWQVVEEGLLRTAGKPLTEVPVSLFFTGQRKGSLQTRSALRDLAEVQIELFRALSRQDEILTYSGSPMLAANGMAKPKQGDLAINVGPKTVLFSEPGGDGARPSWEYVSPDAAAIGEVRQHVESILQSMHRLGMQPFLPTSGDVTATASAVNAAKAHSAVEAWTTALKDCLEQAFRFTADWLGIPHDTAVQVFSDFAVGDQNTDEAALLLDATEATVISRRTMREELRRRNILGPQFDPAQEAQRLAYERRAIAKSSTPPPIPVPPEDDPEPIEVEPPPSGTRRRRKPVRSSASV